MLKSKLTGLVGCAVVLVMLGLGGRQAAAASYTPFTMTFDEFGNRSFTLGGSTGNCSNYNDLYRK
jgi:hypothetical protein